TLWTDEPGWRVRFFLDAHDNYTRTQPSTAMFHATGGAGGSLVFVRVVAITMAIPMRIMHPTITQVCETPTRIAAIARPMMRTMNPIRYVLNEDMSLPSLDFRRWSRAILGPVKNRTELKYDYQLGAAVAVSRFPYLLANPSQRVGASESLGSCSTWRATSVALPQWRPKRAASLQSGFQMSRVAPRTFPPVSSTR